MEWIDALYKNIHDLWEKNGKDKSGYAIFYSPVKLNPDLLIMGYNPGGDETSFDENVTAPPKEHDYVIGDYKMAKTMRFIFDSANISPVLQDSVKTNLIYFRTNNAIGVNSLTTEMTEYCLQQTKEVIDMLSPKVILTEGFITFNPLLNILGVKEIKQDNPPPGKCLMTYANYKGIKVIGIPHPTGSHGLSNEEMMEIGKLIKVQLS